MARPKRWSACLGAEAGSSVTRKITYLVAGADPGSKLQKAQNYGITVLDEDGFLRMLRRARRGCGLGAGRASGAACLARSLRHWPSHGCADEARGNRAHAARVRPSHHLRTCRPGLTPATVTRVVDGDTIRVEIDGEEFRVRYIGIDTPGDRRSAAAGAVLRP